MTITPGSGTVPLGALSVTIDWCDDSSLAPAGPSIDFDGQSVTGSFTYVTSAKAGCGAHARSTGTVNITAGSHTLRAAISDKRSNVGVATAMYMPPDNIAPTVALTPGGGTFTSSALSVTAQWNDNASLNGASRSFTLNGTPVTGSFTYASGSTTAATSVVPLTLRNGPNTFTAHICDASANCVDGSASYTFAPVPPTVSITESSRTGSSVSLHILWNDDVGLDDTTRHITFNGADVTGSFSYGIVFGETSPIPRQSDGTVVMQPGPNTLTTRICDVDGACSISSWSHDYDAVPPTVTLQPSGGSFAADSVRLTVTWCDDRGLDGSSRSTKVAYPAFPQQELFLTDTYVPSTVPGCGAAAVSTAAFQLLQEATVTATICDEDGNCRSQSGDFVLDWTALLRVRAVAQTGPLEPFSPYGQAFTIENATGVRTTYTLTASCTGRLTQCSVPDTITVDPFTTGQTTVAFRTGGSGTDGTITLIADAGTGTPGAKDTATAAITVKSYRVAVSPHGGGVTAPPGTPATQTFLVRNLGTHSATYALGVACDSLSGCPTTVAPVTVAPNDTTLVTVSYTPGPHGSHGRLSLTASYPGDSTARDSGLVRVTSRDPSLPWVVVGDLNAGTSIERDLCLTISAGPGVAYECGDLRAVHALPSTRTMNKERTPVLLYTSSSAYAVARIAAEVTLPAGSGPLDSLTACAVFTTGAKMCGQWDGATFTAGSRNRITLLIDGHGLPIAPRAYGSAHAYTFEVRGWHPDQTSTILGSEAGELAIVDREDSPFGRGWWLAGLEQLFFLDGNRILWLSGDGSTRVYTPNGTGLWLAQTIDRVDSLTSDGTTYRRHLPNGVRVVFDTRGLHTATVNRLGHETRFEYDASDRLQAIHVPLPAAGADGITGTPPTDLAYTFNYDASSEQVTITAPPAPEAARLTTLAVTGGLLRTITGPDGKSVGFDYHPTISGLVVARTDRRGTTRNYSYDWGQVFSEAHSPADTGVAEIHVQFRAAEAAGVNHGAARSAAIAADSAYTLVNGPRWDTTVTRFWVDRFGAPTTIRNALGGITTLSYDDLRWPGLVTRLEYPNGRVLGAVYDGRGNLVESTDSSHFQTGSPRRYATTRYEWDDMWDMITRTIAPEGNEVRFAYEPTTGNRLWQQSGDQPIRRVQFEYYASTGLLHSNLEPLSTEPQLVQYDRLGNLAAVRTSQGFWTYFEKDILGRDTVIRSPIDVAGALSQNDSVTYDINDRVTRRVAYGPAMSGAAAQAAIVATAYDDEGNVLSVSRSSSPDTAHIGTSTTTWRYDLAGRPTLQIAPDGARDSTAYDGAGNPVVVQTRRGHQITAEYDALNRVRKRRTSAVHYAQRTDGIASYSRTWSPAESPPYYPRYPLGGADGLTFEADSAMFTYDEVGNLTTANNSDARVTRTYFPYGLIESETQRIRAYADTDFEQHAYQIQYAYDLNGRRTTITHPQQLAPTTPDGRVHAIGTYRYDPETGALSQVTDVLGHTFLYEDDVRGDLQALVLPGGITEHFVYDQDGRLTADSLFSDAVGAHARPRGYFRAATFDYDARGKILSSANAYGVRESHTSLYAGLGHLVDAAYSAQQADTIVRPDRFQIHETFSLDGLGNLDSGSTVETSDVLFEGQTFTSSPTMWRYRPDGTARLDTLIHAGTVTWFAYDAAGNEEFSSVLGTVGKDRASYYDAEGRLRAADYRTGVDAAPLDAKPWTLTFDEFRYDALGRRVLSRSRRWCSSTVLSTIEHGASCVLSNIRRTVWDGTSELYEIQMPGDTDATAAVLENDADRVAIDSAFLGTPFDRMPFFGRVAYTNGVGIDQPLDVIRINYAERPANQAVEEFAPFAIVPHWTVRGYADDGSYADGASIWCEPGTQKCVDAIAWPYGWTPYDQQHYIAVSWQGTLVEQKRDGNGLLYMRNRYVDAASGRFTQEDPIGLAGGANLYGFADGDPVNFSDPFGLCKKPNGEQGTEEECRKQLIDAQDAAIDNPEFAPKNGMTHCNQATYCVSKSMGVTEGLVDDGGYALLANVMRANLADPANGYTAVSAAQAQALANKGELVIVAGPGHVATVRPDIDPSKKYPGSGPLIANVGAHNGVMRLSRVFTAADRQRVKFYVPNP